MTNKTLGMPTKYTLSELIDGNHNDEFIQTRGVVIQYERRDFPDLEYSGVILAQGANINFIGRQGMEIGIDRMFDDSLHFAREIEMQGEMKSCDGSLQLYVSGVRYFGISSRGFVKVPEE